MELASFNDLYDKTLSSVDCVQGADHATFYTNTGDQFDMKYPGDPTGTLVIEHVRGNVSDLVGLQIEESFEHYVRVSATVAEGYFQLGTENGLVHIRVKFDLS